MTRVSISIGSLEFRGRLEEALAPRTCAAFLSLLPFDARLVQARWSGEAGWIPMGEQNVGVGNENSTSHPAPGQVLLYPAGLSETEILFPYGPTCFSSRVGQLAGNHFLTIDQGLEHLPLLGRRLLYDGAQAFRCVIDELAR